MTAELAIDLTNNEESAPLVSYLTHSDSPSAEPLQADEEFLRKFRNIPAQHMTSYGLSPESSSSEESEKPGTESGPSNIAGLSQIVLPPKVPLLDKFISLHKWEGFVTSTTKDSFYARLTSLSSEDPNEEAEFPLEEVSSEDRPLVSVGAVFYWNIGYYDSSRGQRLRVSIVRFRRLPAWTKREIEDARRKAAQTRDFFGWNKSDISPGP